MVSAPKIIDQSLLSHAVVLFEAMADIMMKHETFMQWLSQKQYIDAICYVL